MDPDGYTWMIGTHKAEPTAKEMKKGMLEMMKKGMLEMKKTMKTMKTMKQQPEGAAAAD